MKLKVILNTGMGRLFPFILVQQGLTEMETSKIPSVYLAFTLLAGNMMMAMAVRPVRQAEQVRHLTGLLLMLTDCTWKRN